MQRYFFNLADDSYPVDLQGTEFPSLDDARAEAVRFVSEVFRERPELASPKGELRVEVTDPNRALVFTLVTAAIGASALPAGSVVATDASRARSQPQRPSLPGLS
jgi:hypothetical protein